MVKLKYKSVFYFSLILVSALLVAFMARADDYPEPLKEAEIRLDTDGSSRQYHELVLNPYKVGLSSDGFIIGIEKTRKEVIGYPFEKKEHDKNRLHLWAETDVDVGSVHAEARDYHLGRVTNDPKAMFVSHILQYESSPNEGAIGTYPVYLAYNESGFPDTETSHLCATVKPVPGEEYETGWKALDCLYSRIDEKLQKAFPKYTHVFVMAMGWNNNQVVSLHRYNALMRHISARAKVANGGNNQKFRPLIIGLTWPSVWGGDAFSNALNKVTHIGSYVNKSDDADEIGYGIANHVVNRLVPRLRKNHRFSTIILGHSFGARILSRAYHSGHLLKQPAIDLPQETKLMINLQGAYSARRYDNKYTQPLHKWVFHKGEGAPYAANVDGLGKIVLTWSTEDGANPMARYLTGAAHVGGWRGHEVMLESLNGDEVEFQEPMKENPVLEDCTTNADMHKMTMVNVSDFVKDHNDVFNKETGEFLWSVISCFDN